MIDNLGRNIEYLRISLTERCNLKCDYCRAGEGACPKKAELSAQEFERITRVMAELGVNKLRLTGGEPLLRRDILEIIERLSSIPGIKEIAMTTNAQQLSGIAEQLKKAGLTRLNISIDSLKEDRYREMTGGGSLQLVLNGIDEALEVGLTPLKLNTVLMRGKNDDEIDDFIALAKDRPVDMRFIELMPLGADGDISARVTTDEILASRSFLKPISSRYESQPSTDYTGEGFVGRVGFISPVSHKFCGTCNRVRVMSDGMLRPCLGHNNEISLKEALSKPDDTELKQVIHDAIFQKPAGHCFEEGFHSDKNMGRIGG